MVHWLQRASWLLPAMCARKPMFDQRLEVGEGVQFMQ